MRPMVRANRSKYVRNMSEEALLSNLELHVKRIIRVAEDLDALCRVQGMTWEEVGVIMQELAGHVGRSIALCKAGSRRNLIDQELEQAAIEGAVRGLDIPSQDE